MAEERDVPEDILYDKRLIDRHIKAGMISRAEVQKRIDAAADVSSQAIDADATQRQG